MTGLKTQKKNSLNSDRTLASPLVGQGLSYFEFWTQTLSLYLLYVNVKLRCSERQKYASRNKSYFLLQQLYCMKCERQVSWICKRIARKLLGLIIRVYVDMIIYILLNEIFNLTWSQIRHQCTLKKSRAQNSCLYASFHFCSVTKMNVILMTLTALAR